MNRSILTKVARFQLADRSSFTELPWAILSFVFAVWLVLAAGARGDNPVMSGGLASIYVFFLVVGALSIFRALPFALALGVSRRSYYAGTTLLAIVIAALDGLVLSVLNVVEGATDGWGLRLHFFRVSYLLAGPWYLTWLTSFVGLALVFIYGMWIGLVYRRWSMFGVVVFFAAQATVVVAGVTAAGEADAWSSIGGFFHGLGSAGLTGLLAALTLVLLLGGYTTMRRVTV